MSRSYVHKPYMKMIHRGMAIQQGCKNSHKYDEKPKNFPSRYVTEHCSDNAKIKCLGAASSLGGHGGKKDKHTMVSGIIRSHVRRENRCIIEQQLLEVEV